MAALRSDRQRSEIREALQKLTIGLGVLRPDLLEALDGELAPLKRCWEVSKLGGPAVARATVVANLRVHANRLKVPASTTVKLSLKQKEARFRRVVLISFNADRQQVWSDRDLGGRHAWIEKHAPEELKVSAATSRRYVENALDQIEQQILASGYRPVEDEEPLSDPHPDNPRWVKRYLRHPLAVLTAFILVVALTASYFVFRHGRTSANPHTSATSNPTVVPLHIDGVTPLQHVDPQEYVYVTPSKVTIPDLRSFNKDIFAKQGYIDAWLAQHHAVPLNIGYANVVLRNTSKDEVNMIGVKVERECSAPLAGTVLYNPSVHGEGAGVQWAVDLDQTVPVIKSNVGFTGEGGVPVGNDYFPKLRVKFAPGEVVTIQLSAMTKEYDCRVRFGLVLATSHGQTTEMVDDHGKPFEVTGAATRYQGAYFRGPAANDKWEVMKPADVVRQIG